MSVILYLWVIILQLYHYDSRLSLKNLNIGIFSGFFFKTFRLSSLIRVYVYIKEKENACKYKVLEKSTNAGKWILQNLWYHSCWARLHELLLSWFLKSSLHGKYLRTSQLFRGKTGGNIPESIDYLDNYFNFPGWKLNRYICKSLYKNSRKFSFKSAGEALSERQICFLF